MGNIDRQGLEPLNLARAHTIDSGGNHDREERSHHFRAGDGFVFRLPHLERAGES